MNSEVGPTTGPPGDREESRVWLTCWNKSESFKIDLPNSPLIFGRDGSCDKTFKYQGISRRHFQIAPDDSGWVLTDLKSSNGTLVNGSPIRSHRLKSGDRISIGGAVKFAPVRWVFEEAIPDSRMSLEFEAESEDDRGETRAALQLGEIDEVGRLSDSPLHVPTGEGPASGIGNSSAVLDSLRSPALRDFDVIWAVGLFSQMGQALLESQDIDQLLSRTLTLVFQNLPVERGSIWLYDSKENDLTCRASRTNNDETRGKLEFSTSIAREAIQTRQALLIQHVATDERFQNAASIADLKIRSAMCAPLYQQGEVLGLIYVDSTTSGTAFSKDHLGVLTAMAVFTASGIEKIRSVQKTVELRNHLESVLRSIRHLVLTLDRDGRLQTINRSPEGKFGLTAQTMREKRFSEWYPDKNQELVELIDSVYQDNKSGYLNKYELIGSDGTTSPVNVTTVPLMDFHKTQRGAVVILEDLTREKQMAATLGRYLSPALAKRVLEDGETHLGGVRQHVTILFSDIRSYTSLTESLDAQEIVELLNRYFTGMVDEILAQDGFLDKYIGDAMMAVFGVPFPEQDDPLRACRAALGMGRALKRFNEERNGKGLIPIQIGIGINTGDVISGNIGSEKRLEYTCIGDAVNLASRIEGVSKLYGATIVISGFTREEVAGHFITRELDQIRVLGKTEPIRVYELIAESDEIITEKLQTTMECYRKGLEFYRQQEWAAAIDQFNEAVRHGDDEPAKLMVNRCFGLQINPPAEDWDGIWNLDHK